MIVDTRKGLMIEKKYLPSYIMEQYGEGEEVSESVWKIRKKDFEKILDGENYRFSAYKKRQTLELLKGIGMVREERGWYIFIFEKGKYIDLPIDMMNYLTSILNPYSIKVYCQLLSWYEDGKESFTLKELLESIGWSYQKSHRESLKMVLDTLQRVNLINISGGGVGVKIELDNVAKWSETIDRVRAEIELEDSIEAGNYSVDEANKMLAEGISKAAVKSPMAEDEQIVMQGKERGVSDWDIQHILSTPILRSMAEKGLWEGIGY